MKIRMFFVTCSAIALLIGGAMAAELTTGRYEYATIRWAGRDNTHLIRPNGDVEFLGPQLKAIRKPERADDRSFYMNIAMNALAKEGYELVAMTSDDYVMKRPTRAIPSNK